MAVSVSPHCSETMPDVEHTTIPMFSLSPHVRGQCISWALRDHCLPNLIFNGSSCLTTHSSVHTSMITVSRENHPGSYISFHRLLWSGTGSQTTIHLQFCTCPLTPHFAIPLRNSFQFSVGKYMTANHVSSASNGRGMGSVQGWIRHARRYFPRCLAREDIACDVDEVMWPDANRWQDP